MSHVANKGVRWGAVATGWTVAVLIGIVITPVLSWLYRFLTESGTGGGRFTAAAAVIALVSGFLAYLVGGYVAGRLARYSGGLNGAMTAVFGLVVGLILAAVLTAFGTVFTEGVAMPPASFGLASTAALAGLVLFLVNLSAGYIGGKLGEPTRPDVIHIR
ncbi:MAG: hypothetical protein M3305_02175 [Actinomycetota bacterium]|nr:hypothetical protein [Actinomycetota bacterium]